MDNHLATINSHVRPCPTGRNRPMDKPLAMKNSGFRPYMVELPWSMIVRARSTVA